MLPPGFSAVEGFRAYARVGRWTSNCVGNFTGGSIGIETEFAGERGFLVLAMYMDSPTAIIFGRDVLGEPKRPARAELFPTRGGWYGSLERHGATILELELFGAQSAGPATATSATFNVKSHLAADGSGLSGDAVVTRAQFTTDVWSRWTGAGRIVLGCTPHDPLSELAVDRVIGASFSEGESTVRAGDVGTIDGTAFLPYALARIDDPTKLETYR